MLSSRCRARFTLPSAASATAVLSVSGARLPHGDARRVILMDESLVMGPGGGCHIRADQLSENVVFHVRAGRLCCRTSLPVLAGGRPVDHRSGLPLGEHLAIGPVTLVAAEA